MKNRRFAPPSASGNMAWRRVRPDSVAFGLAMVLLGGCASPPRTGGSAAEARRSGPTASEVGAVAGGVAAVVGAIAAQSVIYDAAMRPYDQALHDGARMSPLEHLRAANETQRGIDAMFSGERPDARNQTLVARQAVAASSLTPQQLAEAERLEAARLERRAITQRLLPKARHRVFVLLRAVKGGHLSCEVPPTAAGVEFAPAGGAASPPGLERVNCFVEGSVPPKKAAGVQVAGLFAEDGTVENPDAAAMPRTLTRFVYLGPAKQ